MGKYAITKKERGTFKVILLGFFIFYLVSPIQQKVMDFLGTNGTVSIIIGVVGILGTLYFFRFD